MSFLKKINRYLSGNISPFNYDLEKHLAYLYKLPEPTNLFQRSLFQYKSQNFQKSIWINIRKNIVALLGILPIIIFLYIKPKQKEKLVDGNNQDLTIFIFSGVDNIVPTSVKQKYGKYKEINFGKSYFLNISDLKYIFGLLKYMFSPNFVLKCIYKMALYRAVIENYNPQTIICSSEYSFTSSFLTWYCEQNNIKHINVMHGDKLLNIRDSFFQFHECYVWDKHYVELFKKLRADENQFIIDTPPSLYIDFDSTIKPKFELTYYLANETEDELIKIYETLKQIKFPTEKTCIRPHPRYSNLNHINKIFADYFIEDPFKNSISKSINNTKRIASLYSTVLYQGLISGKTIVVDDISQKNKYEKLEQLKFIILSKEFKTLSSLLSIQ